MKTEIRSFFDSLTPTIDATLDALLPSESSPPAELHRAMRYSVFAGGKRLRPCLCVAAYGLFHQDIRPVLPVACALEMAHTYSLIHDDLPAMDDDDFRRGLPSNHKHFGEATAILAGDALLTFAFETMLQAPHFDAPRLIEASLCFARALGTREGMIAGQVLDLAAEGKTLDASAIEAIHRSKTGALLTASVWIGGYLGGASPEELDRLIRFGDRIGLAFQIVDDILDETQTLEILGKTAGKDKVRRKATYPSLFGIEESRNIVRRIGAEARDAARSFGERGSILAGISDFLGNRCS
jgi:geranylgeranyl diphosphate synthase type II